MVPTSMVEGQGWGDVVNLLEAASHALLRRTRESRNRSGLRS